MKTESEPLGTLLVVDDEEMNRDMLARRLARLGYSVRIASSGKAALEALEGVDLVLLDIGMPGMDGFEVLRIIRRQRGKQELPVLMVTARTESRDIIQALELGANDYITKPIDLPVALARIRAHLPVRAAGTRNALVSEPANERAAVSHAQRERPAWEAPLEVGTRRLAEGQPAEAISPLQQALRSVPEGERLGVLFLLARSFLASHQSRPALAVIDQIDLRNLSLEQRYDLAQDLEACEELQQARRFYSSVAAVDSGFRDLQNCLARVDTAMASNPQRKLEENLVAALPPRYREPQVVGQGGMGVIFRAADEQTGSQVAIKVLSPMLAADTGARRRFPREARTLATLEHPGIARILDVAEKPVPYYAMEYLEGASLAALIAEEGPLEPARAVRLLERAVDALGYCHQRGLIHRDIKPANIYLHNDGRVILIDFGLVSKSEGTVLTRTGTMMGTPAYMSPERLSAGGVTSAADIYAIGVTLYECVTRRLPFEGDDLMCQIVMQPPTPPSTHRSDLPRALEKLILRCLEKSALNRFRDCSELAAALSELTTAQQV